MTVTKVNNSKDLKYSNRLQVLRMIVSGGPVTRSEITAQTGLTKMTVSNITADLAEAGFIEEVKDEYAWDRVGRQPMFLRLSGKSPCILGICIGRKYCAVQICDLSAKIISEERYDYPKDITGGMLLDIVIALALKLKKRTKRKIICAGITAMGPVDSVSGTILSPTGFYGIENLEVTKPLSEKLNMPCFLFHDASAAALAEYMFGGGQDLNDFMYVLILNGIGAGIIINGALIEGPTGLGGELGHTIINSSGPQCSCGNRGCLEVYVNPNSLMDLIEQNIGPRPNIDPVDALPYIIDKAGNGDEGAVKVLDILSDYLAVAIGNILNMISLENIFLGYKGEDNGILEEMLRNKLLSRIVAGSSRSLSIHHSAFHSKGPVVGATAYAVSQIFDGKIQLDF